MTIAYTTGYRTLEVDDAEQGVRLPAAVLYPAHAPAQIEQFGPYSLELASGADVAAGPPRPLVVLSHGNNGSPWTHRALAAHLAQAGFVVALVEHLGNSRSDGSLTGTAANLRNRPRHLRLTIDAAERSMGSAVDTTRTAVVGHSIGAYTALAVAGGKASCAPNESPDGVPFALPVVEADPRVRSLVLLAPAAVWFWAEGSLADVHLPILLESGELDELAPDVHAQVILRGVRERAQVDYRIVPGAGHFSFQTPFPPAMVRPDFPPSQDPPGFDRAAFQPILHRDIEAFLRATLQGTLRRA